MAHYAEIDENNIVKRVIVADSQEWCETNLGGTWIQTSYNTHGNSHVLGGTPLRGNFAGIGHMYDPVNDVFHAPQPYPSWTLNLTSYVWEAPMAYPQDEKPYIWDENDQAWVEFLPPIE
jgi:hypothetical protein